MKAKIEKIEPSFGSSFAIRKFRKHEVDNTAPWHVHPEYEIVYISTGKGKRQVGNSISHYENGDLIFLGPNLPHYGFANDSEEPHTEIVVQMKADFLGEDFFNKPEMANIQHLFELSKSGLYYYGVIKEKIGQRLEKMLDMDNFQRLLELLDILNELAKSKEYELLHANSIQLEVNAQEQERIESIYQYVQDNYQESITLETIASVANMTVPSFCRYFKKQTNLTFTQFVNEFRIKQACHLLRKPELTILAVSQESGFNNLSHFNKLFKEITGLTPSDYREDLLTVVGE